MAHPEVGDIIHLDKGMKVHTYIPKSLHFRYAPYPAHYENVIEVYVDQAHRINLASKENFIEKLTTHLKGVLHCDVVTEEKVSAFINSLRLDFSLSEFEICVPSGEYRVYKAHSTSGHPGRNDVSYFVYCEKVDNPNIRCYYSYIIG